MRLQLPSAGSEPSECCDRTPAELPLFPRDPLASDPFCLVLTAHFGLLMVLGQSQNDLPAFQFSFDPQTISQAGLVLRSRLALTHHPQLAHFDRLFELFTPSAPDYRWVTTFSRHLLACLPIEPPASDRKTRYLDAIETVSDHDSSEIFAKARGRHDGEAIASFSRAQSPEMELLQALTHEIRTPLTTIRTLTRLLLRHKAVTPDMAKRLETIDQECTEQIDRMELIFSAAECNADAKKQVQLVPMSLEQIFGQGIPRWKRQAQRRNVDLEICLPAKLPQVVSDPAMLDRVLTGLMEKFTRSLPSGGQIRVQVSTAGHQLKLQIHTPPAANPNPLKALGQLLMFQPATGSLSLNLDATKNLCHALGGKLIVRQRSQQGEEMTIFLPLGNVSNRKVDGSLPRKE
jgi:signal transduction histidine kinase